MNVDQFVLLNGKYCKQCGHHCCNYAVTLTAEEANAILDVGYTQKFNALEIGSDGRGCNFLNDQGLCSVYERRPLECKIYPLMIALRESSECKSPSSLCIDDLLFLVDTSCPAVPFLSVAFIETAIRHAIKLPADYWPAYSQLNKQYLSKNHDWKYLEQVRQQDCRWIITKIKTEQPISENSS